MSIRGFLYICMACVGLMVTAPTGWIAWQEWSSLKQTAQARQLVDALSAASSLGENVSLERGFALIPIGAPGVADATVLAALTKGRAAADEAMVRFDKAMGALGDPKAAGVIAEIKNGLSDHRRIVDEALRVERSQRAADVMQRFISGNAQILSRVGRLSSTMSQALAAVDSRVADFAGVAATAWDLRDQAGRQSSMLLQSVASGKPFTPETTQDVLRAEGRIQQIWGEIERAIVDGQAPDGLQQALGTARDGYMVKFTAVKKRVVEAGAQPNAPYDIDGAEWRRSVSPLLQHILAVRDAGFTAAGALADERGSAATRHLTVALVAFVIVIGLLVVVAMVIAHRVSKPLGELTEAISAIAGGRRDVDVPHRGRQDEIGVMAGAVDVLQTRAAEADRAAELRQTDERAREARHLEMERLTQDFMGELDAVAQHMSNTADDLRGNATQLLQSAEQASERASAVAQATVQASGNIQTVASASEELHASIAEISRSVAGAAQTAQSAVREAEATAEIVSTLAECANGIGQVVDMINSIAGQTNLLALNATIEAARAGEAGKGFAVVAGEVKSLANQTAKATEDIQTKVEEIREVSGRAVNAIGAISRTVTTISESAASVAAAVEEQGAATSEIARNIQEAAAGTRQVSSTVEAIAGAAESTRVAANDVLVASKGVTGEVGSLRSTVTAFVQRIRGQ